MKRVLLIPFLLLLATACGHAQTPAILQLKFVAWDTKSNGWYRLQVNGLEVRIPSVDFSEQDHAVRGTNYRVAEFNPKWRRTWGTSIELFDISEVVLVHAKTGRRVTLLLGKTVELSAPDDPLPPSK